MSYGGGTENHGKTYVFQTISVVCAFQTSPGATGKDLREWFWRARPARIFRNGKRCTQDGLTYLQIGPARPKLIRKRSPTNPFPVAPAKFGTPRQFTSAGVATGFTVEFWPPGGQFTAHAQCFVNFSVSGWRGSPQN